MTMVLIVCATVCFMLGCMFFTASIAKKEVKRRDVQEMQENLLRTSMLIEAAETRTRELMLREMLQTAVHRHTRS